MDPVEKRAVNKIFSEKGMMPIITECAASYDLVKNCKKT